MSTSHTKKLGFTRNILLLLILLMVAVFPASAQQQRSTSLLTENFQKNKSFYDIPVNIEVENASLDEVFSQLEKLMDLRFLYNPNVIRKSEHRLDLKLKNVSVADVLTEVALQTGLTFRQINGTISIGVDELRPAEQEKEVVDYDVQQAVTVIGTVVDANTGEPLPGVTIIVPNTSTGTTTDTNGHYELNVSSLQETLVFSYIGYITQEIPIDDRNEVNVNLLPNVETLNEVVVTALGIEREVRSLTYANQEVDADQVDVGKEINIVNSLQGKISGVQITTSAQGPGSPANVTLRGSRSITNSNQPLYVIDGVPTNGSIEMINSDNVESISVLKGASAAALYGSQGQNGAVIITTKSGSSGAIRVNYNGEFSFQKPLILPEKQYQYGQGDSGVYNANSENGWGPKAEGQSVTLWNGNQVPLMGQKNQLDDFFRTGASYNNTISVQGGNDNMQTFFSYGNTTAAGLLRNNDLTRHNINLKINNSVSSKFSVMGKLNYIIETVDNRPSPGGGGNYVMPSIYRSPTSIPLSEMKKYSYVEDGLEKQSYWNPGSSVNLNPYWGMNRILFNSKRDRVMALVNAKYDFTNWLSFQLRGSFDKTITNGDEKVYADNYWSQVGSNYEIERNRSQGIYADAMLSYNQSLSQDLDLSGNIGAAIEQGQYESMSADAGGLYKRNYFLMNNARSPFNSNSYGDRPQVQSVYATANLGYKRYLYLDITARNDWSSALPKSNQSYFYPSVGLSAILSDMLELPSWVSYGKARVSYASSGFGGTEYLDRIYYSVGSGGAIITPSIQSIGNYKPEITTSFEVGSDWRFLDERLGFNITYYRSQTENQLITIGIPPATLFSQKYINAGLIENSGIELTGNITPIRTNDFLWRTTLNFSKNTNDVKRLTDQRESVVINEGDNVYLVVVEEGGKYGDLYVKGWKKDDQGRNLVTDDGTPILTSGLSEYVGNVNPDWLFSFSSSFSYKNLTLSFLIDHRQGGTILSSTQALIDAYGVSKESLNGRENGIVLDAYTEDGQKNTSAIESQKYYSLIGGRYPAAGFYSYSGTNTRLRELIVSYSLPDRFLNKMGGVLKEAKFSIVGRNLFFFHNSAPVDPEVTRGVNGRGLEYAALPPTRNFGFNFKLSF